MTKPIAKTELDKEQKEPHDTIKPVAKKRIDKTDLLRSIGLALIAGIFIFTITLCMGVWDEKRTETGQFIKMIPNKQVLSTMPAVVYLDEKGYMETGNTNYKVKVDSSLDEPKVVYTVVNRFGKDRDTENFTVVFPSTKFIEKLNEIQKNSK